MLQNFTLHRPATLSEAFKILNSYDSVLPIAGGTDLLVEFKQGRRFAENLVSLNRISEMSEITEDAGYIHIGSTATHNSIKNSPIINMYLPALAEAVSTIGSEQIRNMGTIGGNICTCASCADTVPILMAYDAKVETSSENNSNVYGLKDFTIFHHRTILKKNELLLRIIVPKPEPGFGACFTKFGLRGAASISVASVAASVNISNGKINNAKIIIGACSPVPIECHSTNAMLIGAGIDGLLNDSEKLKEIGNATAEDSKPISDIRGSAEYRRDIIPVLTRRAVLKAIERARK